jgi:predicted lipase
VYSSKVRWLRASDQQIKVFSQLSQSKILEISSLMTLKPLDILKKGFAKLTQTITKKRDDLNIKLSRQEDISSADEHWLDNEGNTIDEQRILEKLESASDYETGVVLRSHIGAAVG